MWLSRRLSAGAVVSATPASPGTASVPPGLAPTLASEAVPSLPTRIDRLSAGLPLNRLRRPMPKAAIRTLEECAFNAWPAQRVASCNGWLLRLSEGYTKRANSANALSPTGSFAQTMALAEAFYARHAQPAIFRLTPLADAGADGLLARAGYQHTGETLVLCASLAPARRGPRSLLGKRREPPPSVMPSAVACSILDHADAAWRRGYADAADVPGAARALHDRLLDAIAMPCGFATLGTPAAPVAFGMGVLERGRLGLFDIVVHPAARRQGAARQLMAALLDWGRAQGASQAYLQVVADNTPAIALYAGLGFQEAYRYHYRVPPA